MSAWSRTSAQSAKSASHLTGQLRTPQVDDASRPPILLADLVRVFTKWETHGTRVRAGPAAFRVRRAQCHSAVGHLPPVAPTASDPRQADALRVRHSATG